MATIGKSWADDVDELGAFDRILSNLRAEKLTQAEAEPKSEPKNEDYVDENGIRTTIEYTVNDEGKRVKITKRTKKTLQKSVVDHSVAERKKWAKFGLERGNKPGPDRATTTVGEEITIQITAGKQSSQEQDLPQEQANKPKRAGTGKVVCRRCKGEHFTAKCPYKDRLTEIDPADTGAGPDDDNMPPTEASASGLGSSSGKYVPPSQRGKGGPGETMRGGPGGNRDDLPTLRVTNISEDTQENDLRELFGNFGRVARVYVGRDRETGAGKGFAFVSFEDRSVAQKAMEKVHGKGYDNLILSVQWSQPRPEQR